MIIKKNATSRKKNIVQFKTYEMRKIPHKIIMKSLVKNRDFDNEEFDDDEDDEGLKRKLMRRKK